MRREKCERGSVRGEVVNGKEGYVMGMCEGGIEVDD